MKEEITVDEHKSVGPYTDMYGHGPVIFIQKLEDNEESPGHGPDITESLWTCLDCGYTSDDRRLFLHKECDRENNRVNQTMREYLEENDYPDGD